MERTLSKARRRPLSRVVACVLTAVYVAAQPGLVCGLACLARGHGAYATTSGHDHHAPAVAACHPAALGPATSLPLGFEPGPSLRTAVVLLPIAPEGAHERLEPATFASSFPPETDTPPPRA